MRGLTSAGVPGPTAEPRSRSSSTRAARAACSGRTMPLPAVMLRRPAQRRGSSRPPPLSADSSPAAPAGHLVKLGEESQPRRAIQPCACLWKITLWYHASRQVIQAVKSKIQYLMPESHLGPPRRAHGRSHADRRSLRVATRCADSSAQP